MARARRIAQAYRAHLHAVAPDICDQLDETCAGWGETWIVPRVVTYDLDDLLTAREAADLANVTVSAVRQWRHRGRIMGTWVDGQWRYRARDVIFLTGVVEPVA